MKYKRSKYQFYEELDGNMFLHYSSFSNEFLLLNEVKHSLFCNLSPDELEVEDYAFFNLLLETGMIVSDDLDETERISNIRKQYVFDRGLYQVVVNTTLDCNLNCWYCYENRIKGSRLTKDVINNVCRNIECYHAYSPYSILKVSFFGGEPFMDWQGMRQIIEFSDKFCRDKGVELILDFTTNATLITKSKIDYLSNFRCHFQITLDGAEKTHNCIKNTKSLNFNCYQRTLDALRMINAKIPRRLVALRINFDEKTLYDIDTIIQDVDFLDRKTTYVIVKKVWQVGTDELDKKPILEVIQKLIDNKFLPDYYIMPKGCVCFAERDNQVLFNYDGNIFKCTTISAFNEKNALGVQNVDTALVEWDVNKGGYWKIDLTPDYCKECKWYGACLGPCNKQLILNKGKRICTFDAMNLSEKEYLMYLFKYNLLYKKIYF